MAYDRASARATRSVRGMRARGDLAGTRALPAYGSIETRPMIQASARNVDAVRSYSLTSVSGRFQPAVTILPSTDGTMWQMTYGRSDERARREGGEGDMGGHGSCRVGGSAPA